MSTESIARQDHRSLVSSLTKNIHWMDSACIKQSLLHDLGLLTQHMSITFSL